MMIFGTAWHDAEALLRRNQHIRKLFLSLLARTDHIILPEERQDDWLRAVLASDQSDSLFEHFFRNVKKEIILKPFCKLLIRAANAPRSNIQHRAFMRAILKRLMQTEVNIPKLGKRPYSTPQAFLLAEYGNLASLKAYKQLYGDEEFFSVDLKTEETILQYAIRSGNIDMVLFVYPYARLVRPDDDPATSAIQEEEVELLIDILDQRFKIPEIEAAAPFFAEPIAFTGNVDMLIYVNAFFVGSGISPPPPPPQTLIAAVKSPNALHMLDTLKQLYPDSIGNIINAQDKSGNTALHHAARKGNSLVAGWLMQNGANPDITNNKGKTAAGIAQSGKKQAVAVAISTPSALPPGKIKAALTKPPKPTFKQKKKESTEEAQEHPNRIQKSSHTLNKTRQVGLSARHTPSPPSGGSDMSR